MIIKTFSNKMIGTLRLPGEFTNVLAANWSTNSAIFKHISVETLPNL